jgi:glycosyltransferase involved in cell wall biosynthesis
MFSVVIPAYNCANTIEEVLDSVRKQTRIDLIKEVIVVNDGSVDETESKILAYKEKYSELNIRYFSQSNHGVSYTRNRGIREAHEKWIALLDSDDIWFPHKIERQYNVIKDRNDICFLGCCSRVKFLFKTYTQGLVKLTPKQLCIRYMPNTPSVVFKKDVGIELGLFDESFGHGEDVNFFQKFFLKDSYYILVEELIKIGIGKEFFNSSGLSSDLKKMKEGRERNFREMYKMRLISWPFYKMMVVFGKIKYLRRIVIKRISKFKCAAKD